VVNLFDATFTNNVQVNIEVGWGEFDGGQAIPSGDFGANHQSKHLDLGSGIVTTTAEQKALGQKDPNDSGTDGWAGFSDGTNGGFFLSPGGAFSWSYTPALANTSLPQDTFYLIGVIEHEFSEVMGRVSNPDYQPFGTFSSPMDAFRLEGGGPAGAYYSVDGNTNWGQWNNNPANGDLGDWLNGFGQAPSLLGNDAFGGLRNGYVTALTTTDLNLMNHLGWTTAPTGTIGNGVTGYLSPNLPNDISQFVSSGGSITVLNGGYLEVMSGFTVGTVFVNSGGTMQVDSGGTANVTQVSTAILTVKAGGTVNNTIVDTGAVNVFGSAFGTTLNSDQFGIAGLTVWAGVASQTDVEDHSKLDVYGSAAYTFVGGIQSFVYVESGGSVSGTNVDDGGVLTISALGSASGTVINSGGYETIIGGGTDSGGTVSSGGIQYVSGLAVGTTLIGEQDIGAGAIASGTIFAGGTQKDNGLVENEKLNDGTLNVSFLAEADAVDVQAGGTLNLSYAGKLTNVSFDGGTENVEESAIDTGELFNGGTQNVLSGATTSFTEVLNGAVQEVFSGGVASGTIIGNIAFQTIDAGGKAVAATVKAGGLQQAFGEADGTIVVGDQNVEAGGSASGSDVQNAGVADVFGTDLDAHVENGGHQAVDVGGSATGAAVDGGGLQTVSAGGFTTGTQLTGGEEDVYGSAFQTRIDNGGTEKVYGHDDSANIVQGTQTVEAGGVASATTIGNGGTQIVSGTDEGATVLVGGVQEVAAAGAALGTKIDASGQQKVDHGGFAIAAAIAGTQDVDGEADGGAVSAGGKQTVEVDGVASGTTVDGKQVDNGTALDVTIDVGGTQGVGGSASGATVSGSQVIYLAGVASGSTVYNGGNQEVTQGGRTVGTTIDFGGGVQQVDVLGFASGTIIEGGEEDVFGSATGTTISVGASEVVAAGGTTSNTTIDGGTLVLSAGAKASGSITFGAAGGELQIFGKTMPKAVLSGLSPAATIDLADVKFKAGGSATIGAGNALKIVESGKSYLLKIDPKESFVGLGFTPADDGAGGTVVDIAPAPLNGPASVSAGQTATDVQVVSGGFLDVLANATTLDTTVTSSGVEQVEAHGLAQGTANLQAHQTIDSGGKASNTTIDYAGVQTVSSGGSVTGTTVNAGGEQDVYGVAKATTVIDANQVDYGTASGTSVDGGTQAVENGGTAVGTTVYSDQLGGGQQTVYGTASGTIIESRGYQDVYGSAVGTVVSSGGTEFVLGPFAITSNTVIRGGEEIVNAGTAIASTISAGLMEVAPDASIGTKPVTFAGGGILKLDGSVSFSGKIQGFGLGDTIDLADIAFGPRTTVGFKENAANTGGTLTVGDGVHIAKVSLLGQYVAAQFTSASDGGNGTAIGDPPVGALVTSMTSPHG
jgi:autotransporter passenger strand-loop-strand repeat protein